mmetsp:Transcript_2971/g.10423  ORF Transcript_2971/g.10423 Transcript_2971/m.10423 type:complete len:231 (-) Transcript_2971:122-814(-)
MCRCDALQLLQMDMVAACRRAAAVAHVRLLVLGWRNALALAGVLACAVHSSRPHLLHQPLGHRQVLDVECKASLVAPRRLLEEVQSMRLPHRDHVVLLRPLQQQPRVRHRLCVGRVHVVCDPVLANDGLGVLGAEEGHHLPQFFDSLPREGALPLLLPHLLEMALPQCVLVLRELHLQRLEKGLRLDVLLDVSHRIAHGRPLQLDLVLSTQLCLICAVPALMIAPHFRLV